MKPFHAACLPIFCLLYSATSHAADTTTDQPFRALIEQRIEAVRTGNVAAYLALLDPSFFTITDTGVRVPLNDMPERIKQISGAERDYQLRSVNVRQMGDIAIVDAEIGERGADMTGAWRETDVMVKRQGRWLYLQKQDTAVLQEPVAVAAGGAERIADYVGHYRFPSGTTDIMSVKGDTLYGRSREDDEPTALTHVGTGAFAIPGQTDLIVFTRDATGTVTGFISHAASGQIAQSHRIAEK